jgi:two-component system, NtrC family, response regulator HydG
MAVRLTIAVGEGSPLQCELEPPRRVTLGRHRSNTIVLQDRHASRRHAEIFHEEGRWHIRDCDTLNGTRLNGEWIRQPALLANGSEIGIGDTRLLFTQDPPEEELPRQGEDVVEEVPDLLAGAEMEGDSIQTLLQADALTALCGFMEASVEEASPRALVARALSVVHAHTGATLTGFLSLDLQHPLPRMVLPEKGNIDAHLSRQLTQLVKERGRSVWLGAGVEGLDSESLASFQDAVCVPLRAEGTALGALHVYKTGRPLREREVRFCEVLGGYLAKSLHVVRARRSLAAENYRLRVHSPAANDELIGDSGAMKQVRQHIARVAPHSVSVLIRGESGVGKELVALSLHRNSQRCDGPLVTVNCGAISPSLLEAELFGHVKGAFTGADRDRTGYFQQADEGTLFLDEIGELSPECQVKLLRVIEGKGFRPVGGSKDVVADVRIIAATHRNLEAMVRSGKFRQDLSFRLGIPIAVPALRERAEDIPALVDYFLTQLSREYRRLMNVTPAALERLRGYHWPGNVRQLRAVLENAVALSDGTTLDAADLQLPDDGPSRLPAPPGLHLEELEAWAIRLALESTSGNVSAAAEILGIHRDTLANKLKKYQIPRNRETWEA